MNPSVPTRLLVALPALVAPAAAPGPDVALAGRPALRAFTDRDGLPQNTVEGVGFDLKGYLWVATQDGVARYDGRAWTTFALPGAKASPWVHGFLAASDGGLWFAREDSGVARLQDGRWEAFPPAPGGLPHARVRTLFEGRDEEGRPCVYAGTDRGPARWNGRGFEALAGDLPCLRAGANAFAETRDAQGRTVLWVGTDEGLAVREGGRWRAVGPAEGLPHPVVNALWPSLGDDGAPELLVGTNDGLGVLRDGTWRRIGLKEGLPSQTVTVVRDMPGRDGRRVVWIGTEGGLVRWDASGFRTFDARAGFPSSVIRSLAVQRDPGGRTTLWMGTFGGLIRMPLGHWTTLDVQSGLPDNLVFALLDSPATGSVWFGTFGGGLAQYKDGRFRTFDTRSGLPAMRIFALLETKDAAGRPLLWVGTRGGGVARWDGRAWTVLDGRAGLPDSWAYCLAETSAGVWAGTRRGLARFEGGRWAPVQDPEGPGEALVTCIRETRDAAGAPTLWVGTRGRGLYWFREGRWHHRDESQGLPSNRVSTLLEARLGAGTELWVGTNGVGLARLDPTQPDGPLRTMTADGPEGLLPSNLIYDLRQDRAGRIYVTTHRGVARFTAEGPGFRRRVFTTGDGLPSNGCSQASAMVDHLGRVWTGTVGGAAVLDPAEEAGEAGDSPLYLEKVEVHGAPIQASGPAAGGFQVTHNRQGVAFHVALLSYHREGDTQYRTQLLGLESAPTPWGPDAKREYPTLPPGTYTFRVWARDFDGRVAGPVDCRFEVLPAPWRSGWAVALYVLAGGGLVAGVVRLRLRILKRHNAELAQMVHERTQELEAAMEALRNQSLTDPLTGLKNRRYLNMTIQEDVALVARTHQEIRERRLERLPLNSDLVFVMVDLDHFKQVNDTWGHAAGDAVLTQMSEILRQATRTTDTVVRWGGEEFLIVARNACRDDAAILAERVRSMVEAHTFDLGHGQTLHRTCSIGFAPFPFQPGMRDGLGWEQVVDLADHCLYAAKRGGRNAWVGLLAGPDLSAEQGDSAGWRIPELLAKGFLLVHTSHPDPTALPWEK